MQLHGLAVEAAACVSPALVRAQCRDHHRLTAGYYALGAAPVREPAEQVCYRVTICRIAEVPGWLAGDTGQVNVERRVVDQGRRMVQQQIPADRLQLSPFQLGTV